MAVKKIKLVLFLHFSCCWKLGKFLFVFALLVQFLCPSVQKNFEKNLSWNCIASFLVLHLSHLVLAESMLGEAALQDLLSISSFWVDGQSDVTSNCCLVPRPNLGKTSKTLTKSQRFHSAEACESCSEDCAVYWGGKLPLLCLGHGPGSTTGTFASATACFCLNCRISHAGWKRASMLLPRAPCRWKMEYSLFSQLNHCRLFSTKLSELRKA